MHELVVVVEAVKKWRHYLLGHHFIIWTYENSLKEILIQIIRTPKQQQYLVKLLAHDYEIQYKSGKDNQVANALSRIHQLETTFLAIIVPFFNFITELKFLLQHDETCLELWQHYVDGTQLK